MRERMLGKRGRAGEGLSAVLVEKILRGAAARKRGKSPSGGNNPRNVGRTAASIWMRVFTNDNILARELLHGEEWPVSCQNDSPAARGRRGSQTTRKTDACGRCAIPRRAAPRCATPTTFEGDSRSFETRRRKVFVIKSLQRPRRMRNGGKKTRRRCALRIFAVRCRRAALRGRTINEG